MDSSTWIDCGTREKPDPACWPPSRSIPIAPSYPHGFALEASGDFVGRGVWTLEQRGEWVHVIYDWRISAEKPLLRTFSFLFKPIFSANHRWAMRMGEKSLELELRRRRATTAEERARIPQPPGPTFKSFIQNA